MGDEISRGRQICGDLFHRPLYIRIRHWPASISIFLNECHKRVLLELLTLFHRVFPYGSLHYLALSMSFFVRQIFFFLRVVFDLTHKPSPTLFLKNTLVRYARAACHSSLLHGLYCEPGKGALFWLLLPTDSKNKNIWVVEMVVVWNMFPKLTNIFPRGWNHQVDNNAADFSICGWPKCWIQLFV